MIAIIIEGADIDPMPLYDITSRVAEAMVPKDGQRRSVRTMVMEVFAEEGERDEHESGPVLRFRQDGLPEVAVFFSCEEERDAYEALQRVRRAR